MLFTELNSRTLTLNPNPNDPRTLNLTLTLTQYSVTNSLFSVASMFFDDIIHSFESLLQS